LWQEGEIFLGNPYEVHSGNSESERGVYEYDVFYPSLELMSECAALGSTHQPRFAAPILKNPALVRQLVEALSSAASEEGLRHFLRGNGHLVSAAVSEEVAPVREACSILQNSVDAPVCWPDLPRRVGCSRGHFIRLFQKVTGIAPNAYLRQLRLSKALHLICSGEQIAAAAADAGFTDQAHLTREFKRAFGRTPGKVARDLTASTHFRSLPAR
jgi:AraC-like DNA-binding protein